MRKINIKIGSISIDARDGDNLFSLAIPGGIEFSLQEAPTQPTPAAPKPATPAPATTRVPTSETIAAIVAAVEDSFMRKG